MLTNGEETKSGPGAVATGQTPNSEVSLDLKKPPKALSIRPLATAPGSDFVWLTLLQLSSASERAAETDHYHSKWVLFVPERFNWIETRCFPGRPDSEDQTNSYARHQPADRRPERYVGWKQQP